MNEAQIPSTPPQEQFRTDVLPPYEEYMSNKGAEWLARAAGNAVSHFGEHVYVYYEFHDQTQLGGAESPEEYIDYLARENQCVELNIIWDFSLSGKHRFLTRPAKRPRILSTATNAITPGITGGASRYVTGSTDALNYGPTGQEIPGAPDPEPEHVERLWIPSCERWFDDVLKEAVDFWRGWLR